MHLSGHTRRTLLPSSYLARSRKNRPYDSQQHVQMRGWYSLHRPRAVLAELPAVSDNVPTPLLVTVVDSVRGGFDVHHQPMGSIGKQLHVVAGHRSTFSIAHHMRFRISSRRSSRIILRVVSLHFLQPLHFS